ncbi:hypothetical protein [Streptomyces sp. 351MFTsu5.1]|uniref:hypothetical protein n=1 Tax=Streptomyces sp. 351MFTsu5.1 TaxID=1172180 RepID=UPI000378A25F|nr:hypothetical protein [Streptomyces sp. 351MFTsu5.1]
MRSRDQLLGTLVQLHDWHPNEANELIDNFARELAEQQRKAIEGFDRDDHWGTLYRPEDVEGLPNLIDPQVQHASKETQP